MEAKKQSINFLDITVYKNNSGSLNYRPYFKSTNFFQYLHPSSHHPSHTFNGIVKSQFIRFLRLSSTVDDFIFASKILTHHLLNRGYKYLKLKKTFKLILSKFPNYIPVIRDLGNNKVFIVGSLDKVSHDVFNKSKELILRNHLFENFKIIRATSCDKNLLRLLF